MSNLNIQRDFNVTIAGLYQTKKGNLRSMKVDARTFDALAKIKVGDTLLVKLVAEATREAKGETFPHAFLEILSADKSKASEL